MNSALDNWNPPKTDKPEYFDTVKFIYKYIEFHISEDEAYTILNAFIDIPNRKKAASSRAAYSLGTSNLKIAHWQNYSTVTDFARLRGLSTSVPRASAVWYASSCSGTTCSKGLSWP